MNEARVLLTKAWEIETALRLVGVKIRKAKYDNLLTAEGFDDAVIQMLNELQKAVVPEEQKALVALLEELNAAWVVMPAELRAAILEEAAKKYLGLTKHIPEIAVDVLKIETKHVVGNTKLQVMEEHTLPRLSASLSLEDARITEAVAERQSHYVKDQYARRVDAHSKFAREEVAKGFKEGFDPETIAKDLKKSMEARDVKRSADYWEMVSSTYCARSRSYGELSSFADAGIDEFEFEAVLDEVTCFEGNTLVRMGDGTQKAISMVRAGDQVVSCMGNVREVTAVCVFEKRRWIDLSVGGQHVHVTPNHPFLTSKGWVRAGLLEEGEKLISYEGNELQSMWKDIPDDGCNAHIRLLRGMSLVGLWPYPKSESLEEACFVVVDEIRYYETEAEVPAYDIEVDEDAGYIANGLVVHNTNVCRFLHGKRFSVRNALDTFQRVADSKDPERVKVLQPWVQNGKEDGEEFLYYRDENGDRVKVADIVQSGVGMIDDVGEFTNGMDRDALEAAGITTPPLHGRCRSTLVPVV